MTVLRRCILRMLPLMLAVLISLCLTKIPILGPPSTWAGFSPERSGKHTGDSEEGRKIYNGKGFCYQCHGSDGYFDRRPKMNEEMRRMIDQLDPPPADLRNPASLKSNSDQERFETIRNGHRNTAMFPHQFLKEAEINDILAYLSVLRSEGKPQAQGSGKIRK